MKKYSIFYISILFMLFSITQFTSCKKDNGIAEIDLTYQMLSDKTWYLDYTITGTNKRTYLGQSTYFIDFLINKTTKDSDGLIGTYIIEKINNVLQIHVQAKTNSANTVDYIYNIESIGSNNLILYYTLTGATVPTKLYFSTNK